MVIGLINLIEPSFGFREIFIYAESAVEEGMREGYESSRITFCCPSL